MTKTVQSIDKALRDLTTNLKRCRIARDALVGFAGLGSSANQDAIVFSIKELTAGANALADQARVFADQVMTTAQYLTDQADPSANGQTAIDD